MSVSEKMIKLLINYKNGTISFHDRKKVIKFVKAKAERDNG
jgi:hypothetical protein